MAAKNGIKSIYARACTHTHMRVHAHTHTHTVGQLQKAVENAATFIAIEPSDLTMANNIRFYKSDLKVPNDFFVPRAVSPELSCKLGCKVQCIARG